MQQNNDKNATKVTKNGQNCDENPFKCDGNNEEKDQFRSVL